MTTLKKISILAGGRIPFQPSGTIYKNMANIDLLKLAFNGIIEKTQINTNQIDNVLVGNVIQEVSTSNVAREAALACNIPKNVPASTIAQACISSSQCVSMGSQQIKAGDAELVLTGGVETFSDVPIRYPKKMRQWLINFPKESKKGKMNTLKYLSKLGPSYFKPQPPVLANYTTGELMGQTSEKIADRFGISRNDQDQFTLRSHMLANEAHQNGNYDDEIFSYENNKYENNIRSNLDVKKLSKLKPSFKNDGTHTAANSSGLTDGATACLLGSENKAKELGINPLGYIKDSICLGTDPYQEMLLGPAYAIPTLLERNNLKLSDIDVFEIHEAFAGQILANLAAMNSDKFCNNNFNKSKLGEIPIDKLNSWGGSIAIGHPLAASNIRNIMTACNRLRREDKELALVAACADSGLANAMLIKRN
ncbi:Thiolase, N-terminal domain [seawater metagenome]|uniref:Thiolase, N-terminal domain n=1 Tax=seawater metagenome TaxID=1561972 RepID=A0A5E8CKJ1_9ZZZZ